MILKEDLDLYFYSVRIFFSRLDFFLNKTNCETDKFQHSFIQSKYLCIQITQKFIKFFFLVFYASIHVSNIIKSY